MASNISFVFREEATRPGKSGKIPIQPGKPESSELMARITSKDLAKRMPPADHGAALSAEQIELFRQWIKEGAVWSEHWAFVPPKPQSVPATTAAASATPVDRFILARLEKEGLAPSPEADRATLLRRVSLDLTGLPPTAAEVKSFLGDLAPGAYERQVDRLLASPHYGERWTVPWLDLARYADTKGYEKDSARTIWKYRDWLIDAFNRNLPYDKFVIDQLAGDLLPDATLEDRLATAFHRNTQNNDEGGTSDEEFRLSAVLDRTSTTWLALNGVTFNCVQCHSHPYDPIRNEEFYRFVAFFDNTKDTDVTSEYPTLKIPDDPREYAEADRLQRERRQTHRQVFKTGEKLVQEATWQAAPIVSATAEPKAEFKVRNGEALVDGTVAVSAVFELAVDHLPERVSAFRLEVPPIDADKARSTPELGFVVTEVQVSIANAEGVETPVAIPSFFPDTANEIPEAIVTENEKYKIKAPPPGFYFAAMPVQHRTRWLVGAFAEPLTLPPGSVLKFHLHHGRSISSKPAIPRRIRIATSTDPRWTALVADPAFIQSQRKVADLDRQIAAIQGTDVPVMADLPEQESRETRRFVRGSFLSKEGPPLVPDVPKLFPPLPKDAPRNRLTLAKWFVAPGQPLTARVAVNRFWEQLFGIGIVETLEDFGSVGEPPSHPELLDWLALHFENDLHWDMKALLRELVLTSTYRQDARTTPALLAKDPRNRLLARGPRNRLTAEMVRDQALVAAGLLTPTLHGPPVMPPQPAGVWATVYNKEEWTDATGEDRYRRALYTYWKRSSSYPSFLTFDTPARDTCTLRRMPTNTPLQALVGLNDPVYTEAGAALAARMQMEGGTAPREQLAYGFSLAATRLPTQAELAPLVSLYDDSLKIYQDDEQLLKSSGAPDAIHAALAAVASAILNLDSVLTK
jgi:hypothetical protein